MLLAQVDLMSSPRARAGVRNRRYGPSALRLSRNTLALTYYLGVLALIVAGSILWATGHGTGDPYLTLGIVFALVPVVVIWVRRRLRRR